MSAYTVVSKILTPLLAPANFLLLLLLIGLVGRAFGRGRWASAATWIGALGLLAVALAPVGGLAVNVLENRFPQPTPLAKVDGIVVLGGSIRTSVTVARGQPTLNDNSERDIAFVGLARRYPEAKLVFSGGTGRLFSDGTTEAAVAKTLYADLGLDTDRVMFEDRSTNTWENAAFSHAMARPGADETWLLVTSARHMPRAVGVFRRVGWQVVPYPVDYRTPKETRFDFMFDLGIGARGLGEAMHEWLGLAVYVVLGRTTELFPGPR